MVYFNWMFAPALSRGQSIGRHIVCERLDLPRSTGGEVWRAAPQEDPANPCRVIKLLAPQIEFGRARAEIAALRMLRLPGIPRLIDEGTFAGRSWLVTEYVPGAPFPSGAPPIAWDRLRPLCRALLEVLARVHREGLVHCDLKPDNVRIDPAGRAWLLDFGLATGRHPGAARRGTAGFAAPEQDQLGRHAGAATDLYAFGCMLARALTGDFRGRGPAVRHLRAREDIPGHLPGVVAALLQTRPEARPRSADEVWRLLDDDPHPRRLDALDRIVDAPDAAALIPLFAGPEPIFHRPSRAARDLFARTDGRAAWVREELDAWLGAGVALPVDGRLLVDAGGLRRVEQGLAFGRPMDPAALEPRSARLMLAIELAWPWSTPARLGAALGEDLTAPLAALEARRAIRRLADGRLHVRMSAPVGPEVDRVALHGALADHLPADAPLRVYHLVRAERIDAAIALALERAEADLERGDPAAAIALMDAIAFVARRHADGPSWRRICAIWASAAMYERHERALHAALVGMGDRPAPDIVALLLARMAPAGAPWHHAPFPEPMLELWRGFERFRRAAIRSVAPDAHPQLIGQALLFEANLAFEQGRWAEAGALRLRAAAQLIGPLRLAALVDAASALHEALDLDQAEDVVDRVLDALEEVPLGIVEGRARWLKRAITHRRGGAPRQDLDWEAAIAAFNHPVLTGVACLTEAAIAWHAGRHDDCVRLAERAAHAWEVLVPTRPPGPLCRWLAHAAGGPRPATHPTLADLLAIPETGVACQFLALLAAAGHDPAPLRLAFERTVPPGPPHLRRAIFSPDEARAIVMR